MKRLMLAAALAATTPALADDAGTLATVKPADHVSVFTDDALTTAPPLSLNPNAFKVPKEVAEDAGALGNLRLDTGIDALNTIAPQATQNVPACSEPTEDPAPYLGQRFTF